MEDGSARESELLARLREQLRERLATHPDWSDFTRDGRPSDALARHPDFRVWWQLKDAIDSHASRTPAVALLNIDQLAERGRNRPMTSAARRSSAPADPATHDSAVPWSLDGSRYEGPRPAGSSQPEEAAARHDDRDDLTKIRGISRSLAARLSQIGITRFSQVAAWRLEDVVRVGTELELGRRISRENWIEQAARLMSAHPAEMQTAPGQDPHGRSSERLQLGNQAVQQNQDISSAEHALAYLYARAEVTIRQRLQTETDQTAPVANAVPDTEPPAGATASDGPAATTEAVVAPEQPEAGAASSAPQSPVDAAAGPDRSASAAKPPDVLDIRGMTPELKRRLRSQGVSALADIANWRASDVKRLEALLGPSARISHDNWIEQAAMLVKGQSTRYQALRASGAVGALVPAPRANIPWLPRLRISDLPDAAESHSAPAYESSGTVSINQRHLEPADASRVEPRSIVGLGADERVPREFRSQDERSLKDRIDRLNLETDETDHNDLGSTDATSAESARAADPDRVQRGAAAETSTETDQQFDDEDFEDGEIWFGDEAELMIVNRRSGDATAAADGTEDKMNADTTAGDSATPLGPDDRDETVTSPWRSANRSRRFKSSPWKDSPQRRSARYALQPEEASVRIVKPGDRGDCS